MAEFLVQHRCVFDLKERSIDLDPLKTLLSQFQKLFLVLTLAVADDRGEQIGAGPVLHRHDRVNHVLHLLRGDRQTGRGAERRAGARVKQAHIVVDFSHRADSRARVFRGCLLLDRNRRRQARDMIDIGFPHHIKELPGIGAKRFNVAALTLCIDGVKGQ